MLITRLIRRPSLLLDDPKAVAAVALGLGLSVRLPIVAGRDFPVNDGGLWYVIANAIRAADFRLPETITFNAEPFPLAYPPLAGYVLAGLNAAFEIPVLTLQLWVPFILNLCFILAFCGLAFQVLENRRTAALACLLFPLLINSTRWFIMGGGVPRSLGFLFQILCLLYFIRFMRESRPALGRWSALWGGLAVLSHPVGALWSVLTVWVWAATEGGWARLKDALKVSIGMAVVSSPWWVTMLGWHGVGVYLAAFGEGQQSIGSFLFAFASPEYLFGSLQLTSFLALLGLLNQCTLGRWFIPLSVMFGLLLDPRGLINHNGALLQGLAAGIGLSWMIGLLNDSVSRATGLTARGALLTILTLNLLMSNVLALRTQRAFYQSLTSAEVASLRELQRILPQPASIAVVFRFGEAGDAAGEWISALTHHHSALMHQGREWEGKFESALGIVQKIEECCPSASPECLTGSLRAAGLTPEYLLIHRASCGGLAAALPESGTIDGRYETEAFTLLRVRTSASASQLGS